ncbi:hypoxanthine phosphoribosyltransferase [Vaginisenegalia massiliensis]|uniref:hypoxanthine phosphoribosyltransferase n=1 Tax=Vaginisenegalia massiliensis TaxID=2058294 RepID=UPI000F54206A|nr:hypoxanthine phosphoribosyltransferase [Vaginisenegalia massiliensis]
MLEKDIERVLVSKEEIDQALSRLGQDITADYEGKDILVIGILRGAAVFMADLVRHIDAYVTIDFMDVSSYGDATQSSGEVKILKDLNSSVEGKHILIVEDIIDTGRTLHYIVGLLEHRKAASVRICTLLDKPERREIAEVKPDYVGLDIPNEFVVGYGLDFKQRYRNLPYIGVLKPAIYQEA